MNINIYLEEELGRRITQQAEVLGKSRNAIVREALKEWLAHHKSQRWPASIRKFTGDAEFPEFESHRQELNQPEDDPLK